MISKRGLPQCRKPDVQVSSDSTLARCCAAHLSVLVGIYLSHKLPYESQLPQCSNGHDDLAGERSSTKGSWHVVRLSTVPWEGKSLPMGQARVYKSALEGTARYSTSRARIKPEKMSASPRITTSTIKAFMRGSAAGQAVCKTFSYASHPRPAVRIHIPDGRHMQ